MAKGQFWNDTFEQLAELGQSTAKKTVKSVAQTLNPASLLDKKTENLQELTEISKSREKMQSNNSTPLDFDKLHKKYEDQDAMKMDLLRNRLFQLVKSSDEQILQEKKQKELETKKQEELQLQQKKKKEEELKRQQEMESVPQGKQRRSLFSPKKKAQQQHLETKPQVGKD